MSKFNAGFQPATQSSKQNSNRSLCQSHQVSVIVGLLEGIPTSMQHQGAAWNSIQCGRISCCWHNVSRGCHAPLLCAGVKQPHIIEGLQPTAILPALSTQSGKL